MDLSFGENQHPLYAQYLNKVKEDKYMKKIEFSLFSGMTKSVSYRTLTQEKFFERLREDPEFNRLWGTLD